LITGKCQPTPRNFAGISKANELQVVCLSSGNTASLSERVSVQFDEGAPDSDLGAGLQVHVLRRLHADAGL